MVRALVAGCGVIVGIVMVLWALWCWQNAADLVSGCTQPEVAAWAVRIGSIALAAAAQTLVMILVVARIYQRDGTTRVLTWCATGVLMLAVVSALALGLAGR